MACQMYYRMVIEFHKSSLDYKNLLKLQIGISVGHQKYSNCVIKYFQFWLRYTQNNAICIYELFFYCKIIFSDCLHIIYACGSVLTSYATFLHRFYNLIFNCQYNCGYEDEHRPQNIYSRRNCICNCNLSNKCQYYFRCPES